MRIWLHIGLPHCGAERLQFVLDEKRAALAKRGILVPRAAGRLNDTRLFMAVADPDHIDPLRWQRGHKTADAQTRLRDDLHKNLAAEIASANPEAMILSASQLSASLSTSSELTRLRDFLGHYSSDIRIVAHLDEPARVLARFYADQILEGRTSGLEAELKLAASPDWFAYAWGSADKADPALNIMPEIQSPPFWLDYQALIEHWGAVFGPENVVLRAYDPARFGSERITDEVREAFDIDFSLGRVSASEDEAQPSAALVSRARQLNGLFDQAMRSRRIIPRQLRRRLFSHLDIDGAPIDPASLGVVSKRFATANKSLAGQDAQLRLALKPDRAKKGWVEADPGQGFRATQYMAAFLPRIDEATLAERAAIGAGDPKRPASKAKSPTPPQTTLSPAARELMPAGAIENFEKLKSSRFAPHNRIGHINEEDLAAQYYPMPPRQLAEGSTGNVLIACMKNEGPYIVEWVAYHRAIGIDNFVIYTNGCEDGTDEILQRLQALGVVQFRDYNEWRGNSPQQFALNQSLKEDVVKNADWITHIDADEFINVRMGNGTIPEFLAALPEATNIAMTWRLFGNNGITGYQDKPVIEQFDTCAPKYCPKPHTVWGFKTMFKNIGAYEKISGHRPNKLRENARDKVHWFNGSGQPMGEAVKERGWRSEVKSIGYDLIQLNHYALRSAESFMIKRQRGRALHVDRSIGLNYWIRMDWSDHKDLTIQRNRTRLHAEMDRLFEDRELKQLHARSVAWHHAKAAELHGDPEFSALYRQALETRLAPIERVAFALALDVDN